MKKLAAAMLRALAYVLFTLSILIPVSGLEPGFVNCNCDDEGTWSIESILRCQKVSDLLIALAYFSIPIELVYFVSCANLPFKWVLGQFIAFIVLCGLTHLFTAWVYEPHSFQLMLALTIFKFLTALVSCATSITLVTMIPLLLRVKVRELFLKEKARELGQEVRLMMRQKEASSHVRMLTREIRKSLDKHTILYTTLVELSKTLDLQNCAVWMESEDGSNMVLTHELKQRSPVTSCILSVPISDPDVIDIKAGKGVKILESVSLLAIASIGESQDVGSVAAIRMPMLRVSNFKGGTPEMVQTTYAILVLVLPAVDRRVWSYQAMEIVEVVADQVAVALSHASVLEESQMMREKLSVQNRALQQARKDAMMASQARNSFHRVMSQGMRRPMHSISGLLCMLQQENLSLDQRVIIDTMVKTSGVISTLMNDAMDISAVDHGRLSLEMRFFQLHYTIREVANLAKCLCICNGLKFAIEVDKDVPDRIIGDEKRLFQVILHMVGNLLQCSKGRGLLKLHVVMENGNDMGQDQRWFPWKPNSSDAYVYVKFEVGIIISHVEEPTSSRSFTRASNDRMGENLSFGICRKLAQMMQGSIWIVPNPHGSVESMGLLLRFQLQPHKAPLEPKGSSGHRYISNSIFKGLQVLLADDDDVNRAVTRKLLERLGCEVFAVSSGCECLNVLGQGNIYPVILLDLHMPEMDGFAVAERIHKYRSGPWPLIVALTACADDDVWEKCLETGMNGVIRKPVLTQGLKNELFRVLQLAGALNDWQKLTSLRVDMDQ